MTPEEIEKVERGIAAQCLSPILGETLQMLGQEVTAFFADADGHPWFFLSDAMNVTGIAEPTELMTAAGPCECRGADCALFRTVETGCDWELTMVSFVAIFRAMHHGPWAREFKAAVQKSGLMDKLFVDMFGAAPAPYHQAEDGSLIQAPYVNTREYFERNGPVEVDGEALRRSPTAFLAEAQ